MLIAAVTHSKVSKAAAVSELELPASKHASDSCVHQSAPVADLSDFQLCCAAAAADDEDPAFQDESQKSQQVWSVVFTSRQVGDSQC